MARPLARLTFGGGEVERRLSQVVGGRGHGQSEGVHQPPDDVRMTQDGRQVGGGQTLPVTARRQHQGALRPAEDDETQARHVTVFGGQVRARLAACVTRGDGYCRAAQQPPAGRESFIVLGWSNDC